MNGLGLMTVTRSQNPSALACGPLCPDEYGVFLGSANTHAVFFSHHNAICERFKQKFAKLTIDSPVAMAKLAIDRASIVFGKKLGDFHSKSGDFHYFIQNREISRKIGRCSASKWIFLNLCTVGMHNKPVVTL